MHIDLAFFILLAFFFVFIVFMIFTMLKQGKIETNLNIIDQNQRNIAKFQNEKTEQNQEKNQKFWYEKMSQLDEKQISLSLKVHEQLEKNIELFASLKQSQNNLEKNLQKELFKQFEYIGEKVDTKLELINEKVENRLKKGFEDIDITFKQISEGITKINEARKVIESLSLQVNSLQDVLTDKKTRGIFGEVQLTNILQTLFGEQKTLYKLQTKLTNGFIADASIKAPMGEICIDSKFPLENFRRINEDDSFKAAFNRDLKNHVNAISSKYIIANETAQMAILFLPAEAIFAYINAYELDIIDYARRKNVWIASPTTLMALVSTILSILRDIQTQEQAKKIQEELIKLSQNFKLYKIRWENLAHHIENVGKDVKDIGITTNKIVNEFDKIENFQLDF